MKVAVLIDGGHLRVLTRQAGRHYDPDHIEKVAHSALTADEVMLRTLYYDCAPYIGTAKRPVSGEPMVFSGSDAWLKDLAGRDLFAVRTGVLKFRGFKPKRIPVGPLAELSDDDFRPDFEQKGVDMRIGLDIATFAHDRSVDRIVLITGDTDCIPAMKQARIAGVQLVLVGFPGQRLAPELLWHTDFKRHVDWP